MSCKLSRQVEIQGESMLVRIKVRISAYMFFYEWDTTLNHLQWILCFHESLWEKHGIRLCINDELLCELDTSLEWNDRKGRISVPSWQMQKETVAQNARNWRRLHIFGLIYLPVSWKWGESFQLKTGKEGGGERELLRFWKCRQTG